MKEEKEVDELLNEEARSTDADASQTEEVESVSLEEADADEQESVDEGDSSDDNPRKDSKDAVIEDLQDRVKRQMAEFDNFRKRSEKEKTQMFEMGASDIIKKLLPIVDNFERGFKAVTAEELDTPFVKGMDMVYKQILKMFEENDVKAIEAVGNEFNPDLHNAVMHIEDESVGENIVVEEFEKGYTYRDNVVRHSMVKVAN